MLKRITLFILTHFCIFTTLICTTTLLGLHTYLNTKNIPYYSTLALCSLLWGTLGALFFLFSAKSLATQFFNIKLIDPHHASEPEKILLNLITEITKNTHLSSPLQVGIYQSPELNAFIIGASRKRALLAISSSLLTNTTQAELTSLLTQEITQLAKGDTLTMMLIQGVIYSYTLFFARIFMNLFLSKAENNIYRLTYSLLTLVFAILCTILGSIIVTLYSYWRIYRADKIAATLAGRDNIIAALHRLRSATELEDERAPSMAAFKITHQSGWLAFPTHPSLAKRIARFSSNHF